MNFFCKIDKKSEIKKFAVQKKNSPFKTQVILFLNLKDIIESGGVSVMLNLVLLNYAFKIYFKQ